MPIIGPNQADPAAVENRNITSELLTLSCYLFFMSLRLTADTCYSTTGLCNVSSEWSLEDVQRVSKLCFVFFLFFAFLKF